ncbi:MAG: formylmethanofuran--tetrahydromethanopterin N-formyltransferase [Rhodospirillaceae bacterium]|nr:formylmethanofuran--tetrahydromethanopterin N-formyltransferase [Rhodospirillaceae bacterium]
MILGGVAIEDTFAEAFGMKATRLIVTADEARWARIAAESMTGFATSVIGCGCEAGIERMLGPAETPDGRPGTAVLLFAVSTKELQKQLQIRVGQCVLTAAGSACFAGIDGAERLRLGAVLRYFGDGFQIAKRIGGRRFWRVPVMDGEFLCEDSVGLVKAVGGGNFLILAASRAAALAAAEAAVAAMRAVPNIILPFPGGIVRSGSKIGSKYKGMSASTNDAYCPTLRGATRSALPPGIESVLEIVIDGLTADDVAAAMRAGIRAVCALGAAAGVRAVTAGNYGGKLGQFRFHLREIMA